MKRMSEESKDLAQVVSAVVSKGTQQKDVVTETKQIVVFDLDGEEYGVPITDVKEILTMQEVTPMPNAPDFIRGILNVRGTIAVVVDLEKRFGLVRDGKEMQQHTVLVEVGGSTFGVVVDRVLEVLQVANSQVRGVPDLLSTKIHAEYLSGVVVFDKSLEDVEESGAKKDSGSQSRIIVLLNLPKLLQAKELLEVTKSVKKAEAVVENK